MTHRRPLEIEHCRSLQLLGAALGAVLCVLLGAAPLARAETPARAGVSVLELDKSWVLTGVRPRATRAFAIPGQSGERSAVRLRLEMAVSPLVENGSLVTVSIDGVPRETRRVEGAEPRVIELELVLASGDHELELRALTLMPDVLCRDRLGEEAWLRIDVLNLWARPHSDGLLPPGLGQRFDTWTHQVEALPLRLPNAEGVAGASLWLESDHLVRRLGLEPRHRQQQLSPTEPALAVWLTDEVLDNPPTGRVGETLGRLAEMQRATPGVAALVGSVDELLIVVGADADDVALVVGALDTPALRGLCTELPCAIGALDASRPAPAAPDRSPLADPTAALVPFSVLGHPRGWHAEGAGRHNLRTLWLRPPHVQLTEWPSVNLFVRVGAFEGLMESSRLTLRINDQTLATWRLADAGLDESGRARLRAPVPELLWTDEAWLVDIDLRLDHEGADPCAANDESGVWLAIDPESRLVLPREERDTDLGIAAFATRDLRPVLLWSRDLDLRSIPALAAVLWSLAERYPHAPWQWSSLTCEGHCVEVRSPLGETDGLVATDLAGAARWIDPSGRRGIPLLPAEEDVVEFSIRDCRGNLACSRLVVTVYPTQTVPDNAVEPPPLHALYGPRAILAGATWWETEPLRVRPEVVAEIHAPDNDIAPPPGSPAAVPTIQSEDAISRQFVNWLWGIGAAILILLLLAWLVLSARRRAAEAGALEAS